MNSGSSISILSFDEALSLSKNMNILKQSIRDSEDRARESIQKIEKNLTLEKERLYRQANRTAEDLAIFARDRFFAKYYNCVLCYRGVNRLKSIHEVTPVDINEPIFRVRATMISTSVVVPGHMYFGERSEHREESYDIIINLDGSLGPNENFDVYEDPHRDIIGTGILPIFMITNWSEAAHISRSDVREGTEQLKDRIEKLKGQIVEEYNPRYADWLNKALSSLVSKLDFMEKNQWDFWYTE